MHQMSTCLFNIVHGPSRNKDESKFDYQIKLLMFGAQTYTELMDSVYGMLHFLFEDGCRPLMDAFDSHPLNILREINSEISQFLSHDWMHYLDVDIMNGIYNMKPLVHCLNQNIDYRSF